jgi:hypothetical protein
MMPPPTGCAGNAARTAFLTRATFPDIAGCGGPVNFAEAAQNAVNTCAPGWSLCRPDQVAAITASDAPGTTNNAACGWVARTINTVCMAGGRLRVHTALSCGGPVDKEVATSADSGTACALTDLLCLAPWRVAIPFAQWNASSVFHGSCFNHLSVECAPANCLITCCRN